MRLWEMSKKTISGKIKHCSDCLEICSEMFIVMYPNSMAGLGCAMELLKLCQIELTARIEFTCTYKHKSIEKYNFMIASIPFLFTP